MKIALIEANQCELDLWMLSQTLANYGSFGAEGMVTWNTSVVKTMRRLSNEKH